MQLAVMMTINVEVNLPQLHPAQTEVFNCPSRFIVLVTGRRWGKTMFGVTRCFQVALTGGRAWWIAPTYPMTRVGWRNIRLMALNIPGVEINKSDRIVRFPGGGSIEVRSGHDPDALRGDGLDYAVMDEVAYMKEEVWVQSIRPALSDRKGGALFISTPKGGNWFGALYKKANARQDDQWAAFKFVSAENPYLDIDEIESARAEQPERIFRQEYLAEILDDVPGALWTRSILDASRVYELPPDGLHRIVVAVDPAASTNDDSSETGIVVVGVNRHYSGELHGYTLEDATIKGSPAQWASRAIEMYYKYEADCIVAESNQGGDMVTHTIHSVNANVPVKLVRATRGKYTRAEPVSSLFERGLCHQFWVLPELEDQLCTWSQGDTSPDRLDAMVWGYTELMVGQSPGVRKETNPFGDYRGNY